MTAIEEFEEHLSRLIGNPSDLRPFVCEGSPLTCRAFIVGFNPATEMSSNFWDFWRSDYGFDKAAWFAEYVRDRHIRPLKPGKTRRTTLSSTRSRIEWILEEAGPVRCLETNIYAAATEQASDLAHTHRITAPFDFLMESIQPQVVVVHGKDAATHLQKKNINAHVFSVPHFARGWSQKAARTLGQQIKLACDA